jgi:hypothetical protein
MVVIIVCVRLLRRDAGLCTWSNGLISRWYIHVTSVVPLGLQTLALLRPALAVIRGCFGDAKIACIWELRKWEIVVPQKDADPKEEALMSAPLSNREQRGGPWAWRSESPANIALGPL